MTNVLWDRQLRQRLRLFLLDETETRLLCHPQLDHRYAGLARKPPIFISTISATGENVALWELIRNHVRSDKDDESTTTGRALISGRCVHYLAKDPDHLDSTRLNSHS